MLEFGSRGGGAGPAGPAGPAGLSAYQVAVQRGFVGTEAAWLASLRGADGSDGTNGSNGTNGTNGTNGLSAYAEAVANGFSGTVAQWLASLKGAKGDTGPQGPAGPSKRIVTTTLTTDASGNATFAFSPAFNAVPHVTLCLVSTNSREFVRITALSASSVTINAFTQNIALLSLLGLDIITAGTTAIASRAVRVMAVET